MSAVTPTPVSQIREIQAGGETFMRDGDALLVKSKSSDGTWYRIEHAQCSCPGFAYRQACRHLTAAAHLYEQERTAPPTVTVFETTQYGHGWMVYWGPYIHGGVHFQRPDADRHAEDLRQSPPEDYAEWLAMNGYGVAPANVVPIR